MRNILISILIVFLLPINVFAVSKIKDVKAGNKLYQDGKYDESLEKFNAALKKDPNSDIVNFNVGTTLYKKGEYEKTIDHLNKSLLSQDKKVEGRAQYNLGNALYKYGLTKEKSDLKGAVNLLEQALPHYERGLALDSKDADAKYNHDFVQKELERLKKKLKEQKQNQSSSQSSQGQKSEKEKDSQGNNQEAKSQESQGQQAKQSEGQEKDKSQESQAQANKQNEGSQDQQVAAQGKKENQESAQANQVKEEDSKKSDEKNSTLAENQTTPANPQELTAKEAQRILDNYSQGEEPKGLLNLNAKIKGDGDVQKDW